MRVEGEKKKKTRKKQCPRHMHEYNTYTPTLSGTPSQTTATALQCVTVQVHGMRTVFRTGRTKDIAWRKRQLEAVKTLIEENHEALTAAVRVRPTTPQTDPARTVHAYAVLRCKRVVSGLHFNFTLSLPPPPPHQADLGGAKLRGIAELGSHANAQMAINNLDSWAADEQVMQF